MPHYNLCDELLDARVAAGFADKPAFIDPFRTLTYSDLQADSRRFARVLHRLGVRQEERVILILADTVEFPVVFFGAARAGVLPVPINTLLTNEQYRYIIDDSRAQAVVISGPLFKGIESALRNHSDLRHVIVIGGEPHAPDLDFAVLMAEEDADFETVVTHADEPGFWLYSSGSTGMPKGTKHVHSSPAATARLFGRGVIGMDEGDVVHSAAKMFFAYGIGNSIFFPMMAGATSVLNPLRPTPDVVFDILSKYNPTVFCGVPTLFASMLHDQAIETRKCSSRLRLCTSAGESLPRHIGEIWEQRFGAPIVDGVGSTEMLHVFLSNAPGDIVYGTSGQAVPGYRLRLIDEEGREASDGQVGELHVAGPSAAEGYWNQREKSRSTFLGEWTRTGDKYYRDAQGRYVYCGRADDMFKVSGIWVSPMEIEAAISTHPAVLEAAVIAKKDDEGLLKPKAFVIVKEGVEPEGLADSIKAHVKASVGMWKYPRWIEIVSDLPKTATGKIQRHMLRESQK